MSNRQLLSELNKGKSRHIIKNRIKYAKLLLENNKLENIIDFDNKNDKNFLSKDSDSDASYDTRVSLKKKEHDIKNVVRSIGGELKYVKSGTTGHTFRGVDIDSDGTPLYEYAVKVVPLPKKDKYGDTFDTRRPENAELVMIKLLSSFVIREKTPHIVLPIGTFDTDIQIFTTLIKDGWIEKKHRSYDKYKDFIKRYKEGEYYDNVSVLISEWADSGDLSGFIRENYKTMTTIEWKVIFFQLISTLAVIQTEYPNFRHNDLKANNILVSKIHIPTKKTPKIYTIAGNKYNVTNIGYQIKLWDFDFACIPNVVDNKKVLTSCKWTKKLNVGFEQNRYYDLHYFFNTLIRKDGGFFSGLMSSDYITNEVKQFILSIVPEDLQKGSCIAENGRILNNIEYAIPAEVLIKNPFFDEFRCMKTNNEIIKNNDNDIYINNFLLSSTEKKIKKKQ
jgi:hypothetical protein